VGDLLPNRRLFGRHGSLQLTYTTAVTLLTQRRRLNKHMATELRQPKAIRRLFRGDWTHHCVQSCEENHVSDDVYLRRGGSSADQWHQIYCTDDTANDRATHV